MRFNLDKTFEANGKTWKTDADTLALLAEYRDSGNAYMLGAVFEMGKTFGCITEA